MLEEYLEGVRPIVASEKFDYILKNVWRYARSVDECSLPPSAAGPLSFPEKLATVRLPPKTPDFGSDQEVMRKHAGGYDTLDPEDL